jgi:hypothetical protein
MACGTYTIKKVDAADVEQTKAMFPGATFTVTPDGSGTYTILATYPACPANTTHSVAGKAKAA